MHFVLCILYFGGYFDICDDLFDTKDEVFGAWVCAMCICHLQIFIWNFMFFLHRPGER